MCGRFTLNRSSVTIAETLQLTSTLDWQPRFNIAPTQQILAVRLTGVGRVADLLRWGLVPPWSADPKASAPLINARAETVAEKPTFRAAFKQRRCLVPAD